VLVTLYRTNTPLAKYIYTSPVTESIKWRNNNNRFTKVSYSSLWSSLSFNRYYLCALSFNNDTKTFKWILEVKWNFILLVSHLYMIKEDLVSQMAIFHINSKLKYSLPFEDTEFKSTWKRIRKCFECCEFTCKNSLKWNKKWKLYN
jgi:hypothetical protein